MVTRRWTLNSRHGYYVATNQTDPDIRLHLLYKASDGTVTDVGTFQFNLNQLADKSVVNRRTTPGGTVFDVKIVRVRGHYAFQVREGQSVGLSHFAA